MSVDSAPVTIVCRPTDFGLSVLGLVFLYSVLILVFKAYLESNFDTMQLTYMYLFQPKRHTTYLILYDTIRLNMNLIHSCRRFFVGTASKLIFFPDHFLPNCFRFLLLYTV